MVLSSAGWRVLARRTGCCYCCCCQVNGSIIIDWGFGASAVELGERGLKRIDSYWVIEGAMAMAIAILAG